MVFDRIQAEGFEQIVYLNDARVGLKAIVALHSTVLGAATGGCRMWNYGSEAEALNDVLRLSKGMTYKASLAGLDWGGGKAIIWGDPKTAKSPALLERFGTFVEGLAGRYITAKDVGIGSEDLRIIKRKTRHILGIDGEPGTSGDPSPATAFGVYQGMLACAKDAYKAESLKGLRIALQGLGAVSFNLLEYLAKDGAVVIGCDVEKAAIDRAVKKYGIEIVAPEAIYDVQCDIFSPSALGASINHETLPRIKAKVIAGAANNQLATREDGFEVMRRGIIYAPDYAINAGGLINIYYEGSERGGYSHDKAFGHTAKIRDTIANIIDRAKSEQVPTFMVADRMAEERVEKARAMIGSAKDHNRH